MKSLPAVFSCLWLLSSGPSSAVPDTLKLVDGRTLEQVTEATVEGDKVKVVHSGGTSRFQIALLAPSAQRSVGIMAKDAASKQPPEITRLVTTDGKTYEAIRAIRIKPSFISFVYQDGAASVRFEKLPEPLRQQCGYDKAAADQFDAERATAETAMAKMELTMQQAADRASRNLELKKRRDQAFWQLQFTDFGANYWLGSQASRGLADAARARALKDGGYSDAEAAYYIERAKFR